MGKNSIWQIFSIAGNTRRSLRNEGFHSNMKLRSRDSRDDRYSSIGIAIT